MKKAKGRAEYLKHIKGERLTRGEAIRATCYECSGFYDAGLVDCEIPKCPLYRYMPYAEKASTKPIRDKATG
jgi:hypothetical protein